jgi:hypothetical protein
MSAQEIQTYIERINAMTDPKEVFEFLQEIAKENPNDAILGQTIRTIIYQME